MKSAQGVDLHKPSKDQYYMNLAKSVSERATCLRSKHGAVIINDDQVVSTGYNGAPRGTKDSYEHGFCLRKKLNIPHGTKYETCRSVHAEQNAIINAARSGTSLFGGTMYIYGVNPETNELIDSYPCFICKKMLVNCGLEKVVCSLKDGGLRIFQVEDWVMEWNRNDLVAGKFAYGSRRRDDE